jgi:hypothetical protein
MGLRANALKSVIFMSGDLKQDVVETLIPKIIPLKFHRRCKRPVEKYNGK